MALDFSYSKALSLGSHTLTGQSTLNRGSRKETDVPLPLNGLITNPRLELLEDLKAPEGHWMNTVFVFHHRGRPLHTHTKLAVTELQIRSTYEGNEGSAKPFNAASNGQ